MNGWLYTRISTEKEATPPKQEKKLKTLHKGIFLLKGYIRKIHLEINLPNDLIELIASYFQPKDIKNLIRSVIKHGYKNILRYICFSDREILLKCLKREDVFNLLLSAINYQSKNELTTHFRYPNHLNVEQKFENWTRKLQFAFLTDMKQLALNMISFGSISMDYKANGHGLFYSVVYTIPINSIDNQSVKLTFHPIADNTFPNYALTDDTNGKTLLPKKQLKAIEKDINSLSLKKYVDEISLHLNNWIDFNAYLNSEALSQNYISNFRRHETLTLILDDNEKNNLEKCCIIL